MKTNVTEAMKKLLSTCNQIMEEKVEGRAINYWEWPPGVGLFGVMVAHEATKDEAYVDFMKEWFNRNGRENRSYGSVNSVIPCCSVLHLYQLTGEAEYREVCEVYADWALHHSVRTSNNGLAHVWSVGGLEDYKNQFWADSVFMAGIFLVTYGKETGNEALLQFGIEQIRLHLDCLYDADAQLFTHGYHCLRKEHLGGHWGRGNGWVVAALARVMALLGTDVAEGAFREIFVKVMERAYSLRETNGMLHTLLTAPDSYTETTATMLFGYAAHLGHQLGVLDERFLAWSEDILEALPFDSDGTVRDSSGGTDCFLELQSYYKIPMVKSCYADGITFMFLSRFVSPE